MAKTFLPVTTIRTTVLKTAQDHRPASAVESDAGETPVVPLATFDRVHYDKLAGFVIVFKSPTPTNATILEALQKVLSYFPHLSGRLHTGLRGRPSVLLNNAGIRLIEASAAIALEEVLPLDPSLYNEDDLLPPAHIAEELLLVKLTRFTCGGLAIGHVANHHVADGHAMNLFLAAWARLVRGLEIEHLPCHDRAAVMASRSRSPPLHRFDHDQMEFKMSPPEASNGSEISQLTLHFTTDFIANLTAIVTEGDSSRRCSTHRCILTHMWKTLTMIRGLHEDQLTNIRISVNGRRRLQPPVPDDYFGNLVLWAYPTLKAGEVLRRSYSQVSDVIGDAIAKINDAYFKSFIDHERVLIATGREDAVMYAPGGDSICPNLEADSWLGFDFHAIDFGGGPPAAIVIPSSTGLEGLLVFVPSCAGNGSVDVFVWVMPDQVRPLMEYVFSVAEQ